MKQKTGSISDDRQILIVCVRKRRRRGRIATARNHDDDDDALQHLVFAFRYAPSLCVMQEATWKTGPKFKFYTFAHANFVVIYFVLINITIASIHFDYYNQQRESFNNKVVNVLCDFTRLVVNLFAKKCKFCKFLPPTSLCITQTCGVHIVMNSFKSFMIFLTLSSRDFEVVACGYGLWHS